jgi:hypothetical protein
LRQQTVDAEMFSLFYKDIQMMSISFEFDLFSGYLLLWALELLCKKVLVEQRIKWCDCQNKYSLPNFTLHLQFAAQGYMKFIICTLA